MATRLETRSEWLTAHPVPAERLTQTLAGVAGRVLCGDDFHYAVREFLDEVAVASDDRWLQTAIAEPPEATGDARQDAYSARSPSTSRQSTDWRARRGRSSRTASSTALGSSAIRLASG
jgi:hypothetical protein